MALQLRVTPNAQQPAFHVLLLWARQHFSSFFSFFLLPPYYCYPSAELIILKSFFTKDSLLPSVTMKASIVSLVFTAALAAAQDLSGLPSCAVSNDNNNTLNYRQPYRWKFFAPGFIGDY
jgi:hypothetical protein